MNGRFLVALRTREDRINNTVKGRGCTVDPVNHSKHMIVEHSDSYQTVRQLAEVS